MSIFSLDIVLKLLDLLVFLLGNYLLNLFLMSLQYIFDLREVSFDDVCHPRETLQQPGHFLFECLSEGGRNLGSH